jgi:hypothetical protein
LSVAKKDFATALTQLVIAGLDPAIHAADKSAWTAGLSPAVTKNGRLAPWH